VAGSVAEPSFGPTSGTVSGWLGEGLVVFVIGLMLVEERTLDGLRVCVGAALAGVVLWTMLLRPRVVLRREALLLRNGYLDTLVPYGLVDTFTVRAVTNVWVGKKRYVGTAVGRSVRSMVRARPPRGGGVMSTGFGSARLLPVEEPEQKQRTTLSSSQLPDFLEERVRERMHEAASGEGVVRRLPAWPEIAATAVLLVAFVVTLLV
jgi:hypothetical protein